MTPGGLYSFALQLYELLDTFSVPAASVVAESMICFVLADALLEKFGGDTMEQLQAHMKVSGKY